MAASACNIQSPLRPQGLGLLVAEVATPCPNTMWKPGELRPGRVTLANRSADSVHVWVQVCRGHTRVGDLGAQETTVFELPDGSLSQRGSLRFVTYRGAGKRSSIEWLTPTGDPALKLVIPEAPGPECPEIWVNGQRWDSGIAAIPRQRVDSMTYELGKNAADCSRIVVKLRKEESVQQH